MSSNMYVCCGMSYEQSKSQSWFDILGNTTYRYTGHFGRGELAGTYDEKDCTPHIPIEEVQTKDYILQ